MKIDLRLLYWIGLSLPLITQACSPMAPQATPALPIPTITQSPDEPPTTKPADTPETTVGAGMQCTTLQDINLRTGPGLAYRNPIGVVLKDSVIEPVGFVPEGIPGGSWVKIEADGDNPGGWVTAGAQYITCNMDLTSLPVVEFVPPPPPPLPKSAQTSDPEGGCGPKEDYQCEVILTDESFLEFKIFKNGKELTQEDDVMQVSFSVRQGGKDDNGAEIYSVIEVTSAYCILGGNGPCNNWPLENNVTVWPNGPTVLPGVYFVEIFATVDENGKENNVRWAAEFVLTQP